MFPTCLCVCTYGLTEIAGLDIDGLANDGRIWAIDCNLLKVTIQRFYQLTGPYNSFESVLCLKTYEIHIDKQKLRTCNEYYSCNDWLSSPSSSLSLSAGCNGGV